MNEIDKESSCVSVSFQAISRIMQHFPSVGKELVVLVSAEYEVHSFALFIKFLEPSANINMHTYESMLTYTYAYSYSDMHAFLHMYIKMLSFYFDAKLLCGNWPITAHCVSLLARLLLAAFLFA